MQRTLDLLNARSETLPEIAAASGINFYWLQKFKSRTYRDPSVNTVQRLFEYLSDAPLFPPRKDWCLIDCAVHPDCEYAAALNRNR